MDNNQQLNHLFERARKVEISYSFEEIKSQFIHSQANPGKSTMTIKSFINLKNGLIMLTLISTTILLFYVQSINKVTDQNINLDNAKQTENTNKSLKNNSTSTLRTVEKSEHNASVMVASTNSSKNLNSMIASELEIENEGKLHAADSGNLKEFNKQKSSVSGQDDQFVPKLTEEDIKQNNKRKKQMLKAVSKTDRKMYAYIPSGTFEYQGNKVSVQAFNMSTLEVSVLEYKTFLWDMIIQGRISEFHKAKPRFNKWVEIGGKGYQYMVDNYFSEESFENHPINNITREGAELYCKWLTQEVNKLGGEPINDIRIPTRTEWVFAASGIGTYIDYPWDGEQIINESGCAMANFNYQLYPNKSKIRCEQNSDVENAVSTAEYVLGENKYTAINYSYNSNSFGLYGMSGNVAEMVYEQPSREMPGTAGGGWMNSAEEIKITAPDNHSGENDAHPNIGFRVVFTHLGKGLGSFNNEPNKDSKYPDQSWTITPSTSKSEIEAFSNFASKQGWVFECKTSFLSNKIYRLKFNLDQDHLNSNCGGINFHDSFFVGDKSVTISWKEGTEGMVNFDFVATNCK